MVIFGNTYRRQPYSKTSWDGERRGWHWFFMYFLNGAAIVYGVLVAFQFGAWAEMGAVGVCDIISYIISIVMAIASIILFRSFSWWCVRLLVLRYLFGAVYMSGVLAMTRLMYGADVWERIYLEAVVPMIVKVIMDLVIAFLIYLYYKDRRLLFLPEPNLVEDQNK